MHINTLKLTNFRNISSADLKIDDAKVVALYGENGAGKTNIMEAISLLTPGRGLHRTPREQHVQTGENSWTIFSEISTSKDEHTLGYHYEKGKSTLKIDGDIQKNQSALSSLGNILWFTPKMDRLFMDGTSARREFLDRLAFGHYSSHASHLNKYKHHLKSRLKLLKQNAASDWIAVEEEQAAKLAKEITQTRLQYLEELKKHLSQAELSLSGSIEKMADDEYAILEKFTDSRKRDAMFGSSHFGPQRSTLSGLLTPENIALDKASTGQHKRAILNIILANARLSHEKIGQTPIVLLDEVTAHLDKKVRANLFGELTSLGTQIWLTGTEKDLFSDLKEPLLIHTEAGKLSTS